MRLRAHHLLCVQKFTGHGYDGAFTEHMKKLVARLGEFADEPITVVDCCDDICAACPENGGGVCGSRDKTARLDADVMRECSLSVGETRGWVELSRTARERIFETEKFGLICRECEWYELCLKTDTAKKARFETENKA